MDDVTAKQVFAIGLILLALGGFGVAEVIDRLKVHGWWPMWNAKKDQKHP